ncbi:MAG TPA: amidase family protein, partial [Jatrophihabitans sp.]|nr:amidase family protein [Jatrophihabitans sp.]
GDRELTDLGVVEAATAIRDGAITARAYAAALLRRAEAQSDLRSFITIDEPAVLAAAAAADNARAAGTGGPLLGVPLGVKDSYQTRDLPTTIGLEALHHFVPATDAELVRAVKAAGGIVFGKNNLVELSYGVTGHNEAYGQVLNPYGRGHLSGGSSSGSAAAVAARIVPAAFGGDTVGSIRIPAALTGVVGFKPTTGRWPREGVVPISPTLDTTGLLARHVEDVQYLDRIVTGEPPLPALPGLAGVRLAYAPEQHLQLVDPEVAKRFSETVALLRTAGAEVAEIDLGDDFAELAERTGWNLFLRETHRAISQFLAANDYPVSFEDVHRRLKPQLDEVWRAAVVPGSPGRPSDDELAATRASVRPKLQQRYRDLFTRDGFDALILPTTAAPAPAIADQWEFAVAGQSVPHLFLARNTIAASGAGIPAISLPSGLTDDGLPVGLELDGAHRRDRELLALTRRVEDVLGPLPSPA